MSIHGHGLLHLWPIAHITPSIPSDIQWPYFWSCNFVHFSFLLKVSFSVSPCLIEPDNISDYLCWGCRKKSCGSTLSMSSLSIYTFLSSVFPCIQLSSHSVQVDVSSDNLS
jgi:hypothetical protein